MPFLALPTLSVNWNRSPARRLHSAQALNPPLLGLRAVLCSWMGFHEVPEVPGRAAFSLRRWILGAEAIPEPRVKRPHNLSAGKTDNAHARARIASESIHLLE